VCYDSGGVAIRENKQLLKQLHDDGFPNGPAAIERFFAKDYVAHGLWGDLDGLKTTLQSFLDVYPNAQWSVEEMIGEGDKVAVRAKIEIRAAAGIVRSIGSTMIYRMSNNRIVEQWGHGEPLF
jgi:predicted ester cyclase